MAINLQKKSNTKITSSNKFYKNPKSVRLLESDLILLEKFKERIENITSIPSCSNTQAFKVMLRLTRRCSDTIIKKALSTVL